MGRDSGSTAPAPISRNGTFRTDGGDLCILFVFMFAFNDDDNNGCIHSGPVARGGIQLLRGRKGGTKRGRGKEEGNVEDG